MLMLKAAVGWCVPKRTEENFIRISVSAYLKPEIVLAGYTLNIMMATIRMEKRPIKELSLSNMNLINHSCCRCDS